MTGVVVNMNNHMLFSVRFYDGREDIVPREEVYFLSHEKFSADVEFIVRCEESLVGKAVVARNDADGLFYLGKFLSKKFDQGAIRSYGCTSVITPISPTNEFNIISYYIKYRCAHKLLNPFLLMKILRDQD